MTHKQVILSSKDIPFPHNGFKSCRIEIDLTHPLHILQRHIWKREDGSVLEEDWIRSIHDTEEQLLAKGYKYIKGEKATSHTGNGK